MENDKIKELEKALKNGESIEFTSDDHSLSLHHVKSWDGRMRFLLWFNGIVLKSAFNFKTLIKDIDRLIEKHNLTESHE